tara:strand:- start:43033 stop:44292 length:1260 start_codon:yes stop_codon:yes gene_type:complete
MHDNSLAVISSATVQHRNGDAEHLFRQDSYFSYLTGFEESFAVAVFLKVNQKTHYILFCQDKNPEKERWTGHRMGVLGAQSELGADHAYPIAEAGIKLPQLFKGVQTLYYLVGAHPAFEAKLFSWVQSLRQMQRQGIAPPEKYIDLRVILDESRLIKDKSEIACMRKAAEITMNGHRRAMLKAKPGLYEYHLEAELQYAFYQGGSRSPAYNSIVAAGANACILHYVNNNCELKNNDLVLIDAGAEYQNYAADVTRTFPVNGQFSSAQQAIYELVLASQLKAIEMIKPGVPWGDLQTNIVEVLVTGLVDLGVLTGDVDGLIEREAYKPFYMHNSGHWLGLDVHDTGAYKIKGEWRPLKENMVLTVEPGIYIDQDNESVPEKWRGIGVRIEDDVVVTDVGSEVLTDALPKSVNEIQQFMQS